MRSARDTLNPINKGVKTRGLPNPSHPCKAISWRIVKKKLQGRSGDNHLIQDLLDALGEASALVDLLSQLASALDEDG